MKYYQDITLIPDAEANLGFLWQKVYQQVHLALVGNKIAENLSAIAVSFPKYGDKEFPLGNKLRLFADTQEQLEQLDIGKWLNRLTDYVHCTSVKDAPLSVSTFVCFKRKQFDSNVERLARRRAKYKNESFEEAMEHFSDFKLEISKLPFVNTVSLSTKESVEYSKKKIFRLFIEKKLTEDAVFGEFNCYGLSKTATIPWF